MKSGRAWSSAKRVFGTARRAATSASFVRMNMSPSARVAPGAVTSRFTTEPRINVPIPGPPNRQPRPIPRPQPLPEPAAVAVTGPVRGLGFLRRPPVYPRAVVLLPAGHRGSAASVPPARGGGFRGVSAEVSPETLGHAQIRQTDGGASFSECDESERESRGERVPLASLRGAFAAWFAAHLVEQNFRHESVRGALVEEPHGEQRRGLHGEAEFHLRERGRVTRGEVQETHLGRVRVHRPSSRGGGPEQTPDGGGVVFLHQVPVQIRVRERAEMTGETQRHQHPRVRVRRFARTVKDDPRAGQFALGSRSEREPSGDAVVKLGPPRKITPRGGGGKIEFYRRVAAARGDTRRTSTSALAAPPWAARDPCRGERAASHG